MEFLASSANYITSSLLSVFGMLVILRFVLQWARADFYNPISQGIVKVTTPLLRPLRRIIPGFAGLDIAALVLAILIYSVSIGITALLLQIKAPIFIFVLIALFKVMATLLNIASFTLLASIIISFIAPMTANPIAQLLQQIAEPLMKPWRKVLPDTGLLDFSPIIVIILLGLLTKALMVAATQFGIPSQQIWMFVLINV